MVPAVNVSRRTRRFRLTTRPPARTGLRFALVALFVVSPLSLAGADAEVWQTVRVDDDAPGDPGPNDPNLSDPLEDGTAAHPFDTINEALGALPDYLEILVAPGAYVESLGSLPPHCRITGAGAAATLIASDTGIHAYADGWGLPEPPEIALGDFSLTGPGIDLSTESYDWNVQTIVTIDRVTLVSGDASFFASGGYVGFHGNEVRVMSGAITLVSAGSFLDASLTGADAAGGMVQYYGLAGGYAQTVISGGFLEGIQADGSYGAALDVEGVTFTGPGIHFNTSESGHSLHVADSTFRDGGVFASAYRDSDGYNGTDVSILRSRFQGDGIQLYTQLGGGSWGYPVDVTQTIDSCLFEQGGVGAAIADGLDSGNAGSASLRVTNNVFLGTPGGIGVDYDFGDAIPPFAQTAVETTILNNTFVGSTTGVRVTTTPHVPGRDPLVTTVANNIVVDGATGIVIDGTDDLQLTVTGNDVFGHTLADYDGDLDDPTGVDGNISADPLLADPGAGDVSLLAGSPCIDAATPVSVPPSHDFLGTPRPQDGDGDGTPVSDIGAVEFLDADQDGYAAGSDCDDGNPRIHPGAVDVPGNSVDEDCDGVTACDPDASWAGHGRFMSCVARTCDALVASGDLLAWQCEEIVRIAAGSDAMRR